MIELRHSSWLNLGGRDFGMRQGLQHVCGASLHQLVHVPRSACAVGHRFLWRPVIADGVALCGKEDAAAGIDERDAAVQLVPASIGTAG